MRRKLILLVALCIIAWATWTYLPGLLRGSSGIAVQLRPNLEQTDASGSPFTPSTQSLTRGHHALDEAVELKIDISAEGTLHCEFIGLPPEAQVSIHELPLKYLMPHLFYPPADPPDAFDAFNLLLAEYSRNGVSVPVGSRGDSMAHFRTPMKEGIPWKLGSDYEFEPNPLVRPLRMSVINNCLNPGLWECNGADKAGEMYHAWFTFPQDDYASYVARFNGVDPAFAGNAVEWRTESVPLELDRLRTVKRVLGEVPGAVVLDQDVGFSSQDSRRKISKRFARVEKDGAWTAPEVIGDLTARSCQLVEFVPPGLYSLEGDPREFDFSSFRNFNGATVAVVDPLTRYPGSKRTDAPPQANELFLEITLHFEPYQIVLGNLPAWLITSHEEYPLFGFGVGIPNASGLAERRKIVWEEAPPPSYAYLCREGSDGKLMALNSHEFGIEQMFLRARHKDADPHWELTISSYERIVDIARLRFAFPDDAELVTQMREFDRTYVTPRYFAFRDDNIR